MSHSSAVSEKNNKLRYRPSEQCHILHIHLYLLIHFFEAWFGFFYHFMCAAQSQHVGV